MLRARYLVLTVLAFRRVSGRKAEGHYREPLTDQTLQAQLTAFSILKKDGVCSFEAERL